METGKHLAWIKTGRGRPLDNFVRQDACTDSELLMTGNANV
jgi:hypothetical protein